MRQGLAGMLTICLTHLGACRALRRSLRIPRGVLPRGLHATQQQRGGQAPGESLESRDIQVPVVLYGV